MIIPVFALANAGVSLGDVGLSGLTSPVTLGIFLGLVIGKPFGIVLFSWLAVRLGIGAIPRDIGWLQILGASLLGGIGFTMSIFITGLAFEDDSLIAQAKFAILIASLLAGTVGYILVRYSHEIHSKFL